VNPSIAILDLDINNAKLKLMCWSKTLSLPKRSDISKLISELEINVDYAYKLLKASRLIPLTYSEKLINLGKKIKPEYRVQSVKVANKAVTRDHMVFGHIFRIMEMLIELMASTAKEKVTTNDAINKKKEAESKWRIECTHASAKEVTYTSDLKTLQKLSVELVEISKLCNLLYKYYSEYILRFVEEYGERSSYKLQFSESNAYMLALAKLVDHQLPLFDATSAGVIRDDEQPNPLFSLNG
jgi:hypothetical protein